MLIKILRFSGQKDDTLSLMFVDDKFFSFGIEDEKREVKIKGETRIPAGQYELKINKEETPKTTKYRSLYAWFKYHLQIMNIPNFDKVYIHIGNDDGDSDGCYLAGDSAITNLLTNGSVGYSLNAFHRFYDLVYPILEKGIEKVHIRIIDEPFIEKL